VKNNNMMDNNYETTGLTYVETIVKPDDVEVVVFINEKFYYSAQCYTSIIQFVGARRCTEPLSDGLLPTPEECHQKDLWRENFNGNPQPLQDWIDNLP
jgi:hypothetical protein